MKLPSKGSRPPSPSDFLDKLMGRTSGYDARIRPNFKGNRHTVLGGTRWDEHLLSGQVWEWAPCSFCVTLLGSEVAQITHRWVSRERCCWLWCFHTEERFSLCHVCHCFSADPQPQVQIFFFFAQISEMCSYPHMLPHRPISSQSRSLVVSEAGRFSLTHFPLTLRGHISYIFHPCSTSLSVHAG